MGKDEDSIITVESIHVGIYQFGVASKASGMEKMILNCNAVAEILLSFEVNLFHCFGYVFVPYLSFHSEVTFDLISTSHPFDYKMLSM